MSNCVCVAMLFTWYLFCSATCEQCDSKQKDVLQHSAFHVTCSISNEVQPIRCAGILDYFEVTQCQLVNTTKKYGVEYHCFVTFHFCFTNFHCNENSASILCFVINNRENCIVRINQVHYICTLKQLHIS